MIRKEIIEYVGWRTLSNFLILFAVFGIIATFGPTLYYEASYQIGKIRGVKYELAPSVSEATGETELGKLVKKYNSEGQQEEQGQSLLGNITATNTEKILVPPNTDFSIVVPKIGAAEKITANVDPSNKDEYLRALTDSIAHAKGTAYPGINGTTYLFAHSADNFWDIGRYNAVFYLLKDMQPGDEIYVFYKGQKYTYAVYDNKLVDSSDVSYVDANLGKGERLILQTCWPPGTDWKRTLVFAKPKGT